MDIVVNGLQRSLPRGATVADLVAEMGHDLARPGVAVAVNGMVVTRGAWEQQTLHDGDRVEVLGAAQGG
ncbi:MAG: sulfur carrier protein ThiS [Egibacteraceae bacterium]